MTIDNYNPHDYIDAQVRIRVEKIVDNLTLSTEEKCK